MKIYMKREINNIKLPILKFTYKLNTTSDKILIGFFFFIKILSEVFFMGTDKLEFM